MEVTGRFSAFNPRISADITMVGIVIRYGDFDVFIVLRQKCFFMHFKVDYTMAESEACRVTLAVNFSSADFYPDAHFHRPILFYVPTKSFCTHFKLTAFYKKN